MKQKILLLFFVFFISKSYSQIVVGVKFTGLAFHPRPINGAIFRGKLEKKGYLVMNAGLAFTAQYYINNTIGLGVAQVIMPQDCGGKWFGATQVGLALKYDISPVHSVHGVFGPILFYRENWASIPNYKDDTFFKKTKDQRFQYKFVWHGADLEYTYWFAEHTGLAINLLPGIPEIFELSPGMNFK